MRYFKVSRPVLITILALVFPSFSYAATCHSYSTHAWKTITSDPLADAQAYIDNCQKSPSCTFDSYYIYSQSSVLPDAYEPWWTIGIFLRYFRYDYNDYAYFPVDYICIDDTIPPADALPIGAICYSGSPYSPSGSKPTYDPLGDALAYVNYCKATQQCWFDKVFGYWNPPWLGLGYYSAVLRSGPNVFIGGAYQHENGYHYYDVEYICHTYPEPKNLGSPSCQNCSEGNPINAAVGNKFQAETDYVGATNTKLELRRYYNSQDAYGSSFGAKWHSTYHRGLVKTSDSKVRITRADGSIETFALSSGVWASEPDVTSKLTAITDGGGTQTGWKLLTEADYSELYSLDGRLLSIATRAGLVTQLTYDANNKLTQVTGPFGHTLKFSINGAGLVSQVTLPDGSLYTYGYDDTNNLVTVSYGVVSKTYVYGTVYDLPGKFLKAIIDENGNQFATYAYDENARAISSSHAGGADQTTLTYNANGTTTATDAKGNAHTYSFTTQFGVVKPVSVSGTPCLSCGGKAFTYDANGFIASRTDFNGNITKYVHNTRGLETSRTEAFGTPQARTITTAWHPTYRLPTKITEPNRTTSFVYDAKGNLIKKTITAGTNTRTWIYAYNAYGQVTAVNGPRTDVNDITRYAYDVQGNLISITDALNHVTKITAYDGNGRPLTIVDPNGLTTTLTYDYKGRITSRNIGGELTQYAYDNVGNLLKVTRPDGSYNAYAYDTAHRLTQISDSLGNKIVYTLDASGNPTAEQVYDPSGTLTRTHSREFDALNRLAKSINAEGQAVAFAYDNNGNLTGVTAPLGNASTYGYDALDRLIASVDPTASKTQYGYDANDNPVKITDPRGAVTNYAYDGLDDRTQVASPDTGTTQNGYDAAGNLISTTDARGKTTTYSYDALNRVTQITFASGTPVTFTYDKGTNAIGRLVKITDETGTTQWGYDPHGRVTVKVQTVGTLVKTTRYAYDTKGRLASVTYPSGRAVNLAYDGDGRVAGLTLGTAPLLQNIQYAPFGAPQSWTWGNSQPYSRSYDQDGRLTAYPLGRRSRALAYDAASRITDYTDSDPTQSQHFEYDAASRLASATLNPAAAFGAGKLLESFAYDTTGNRLSASVQTGTTRQTAYSYGGSGNQLTQVSPQGGAAQTYAYDAAGNTLSDGIHNYAYSDRGRLATADASGYALNGLGQRVKKTTPQGVTLFVYDEAGHLVGEYDGTTGKPIRETVYLGDTPVAVIAGGVASYVHADHLDAPRALVDGTGKTVWRWDSEPFGTAPPNEDPDGDKRKVTYNLRFPGQYYDIETGLHYNYFRDYSPILGRYIESDPIGLAGGINTYGYVSGNPVSAIDYAGKNLVYLNDKNAAYSPLTGQRYGHSAFIAGNDVDGYVYYSKDGGALNRRIEFKNINDFFNSGLAKRYDRALYFKTSKDVDTVVRDYADAHYNDEYDFSGNNCSDLVLNSFEKANIDISQYYTQREKVLLNWFMPTIPNVQYSIAAQRGDAISLDVKNIQGP